MDTNLIKTKFAKLGARARIGPFVQKRGRLSSGQVVIDVQRDRHGEFFDIQADDGADVEVLDVQSKDRHLLLMVRQPNQRPGAPDTKAKFLCRDEHGESGSGDGVRRVPGLTRVWFTWGSAACRTPEGARPRGP
jgi:hypothetical protein